MRAIAISAALLLGACVAPANAEMPSVATPSPVASPTATPPPSPAMRGAPPASTGAAADAGVLFVRGPDDWIYRYDGATGQLTRATRHATIQLTTSEGAYAAGFEGGLELLRWDGRIEPLTDCGPGRFQIIGPGGCLSYGDSGVWVRLRGEPVARLLLPSDWGAGQMALSPDGRRIAVLRAMPGSAFEERAHNALWIIGTDGTPRLVHEARGREAFVFRIRWSPDGRWLTVWEQPIVSNSVAADGDGLLLVDATSGRVTDLGKTLLSPDWIQWSSDGRLAYVRGGDRQTWLDKTLVVRSPDGRETTLTDRDHVGLAPAWTRDPLGRIGLMWVQSEVGDGNGGVYVRGTGAGTRYGMVSDDLSGAARQLAFPRIVEGIRPSADGHVALVLVRRPSPPPVHDEYGLLELWLMKPPGGGIATQVPLITGLGGLAFGFYGLQPSLFTLVAWSRDPR